MPIQSFLRAGISLADPVKKIFDKNTEIPVFIKNA